MNLATALLYLFPDASPLYDFEVRDNNDGNGQYIAVWNLDELQPTVEELQSAWELYVLDEANRQIPKTIAQEILELKQIVADLASLQLGV